jgi:hypothetical protein
MVSRDVSEDATPRLLAWTEHNHEQAVPPETWTQHFEDPKLEYMYSSGQP